MYIQRPGLCRYIIYIKLYVLYTYVRTISIVKCIIFKHCIMAFPKSPKKWARVFARIALKASRFNEIASNLFYSNPCNETQLLH